MLIFDLPAASKSRPERVLRDSRPASGLYNLSLELGYQTPLENRDEPQLGGRVAARAVPRYYGGAYLLMEYDSLRRATFYQ